MIRSFAFAVLMTSIFLSVVRGQDCSRLPAGDADMDLDFDQLDLVLAMQTGKYLTGEPVTWGEGDWNGAPGGRPGNPPIGDGQFNQLDVIAAVNGVYF